MIITNIIKDSFIDYKGEQALVVFTQGCNLNCNVCYNREVKPQFKKDIFQVLEEYLNPMHTALVISGGEPTLNTKLDYICSQIKLKYPELKIKIFSNGQKPEVVRDANAYVDAWSIDYKTYNSNDKILGGHYPLYKENVLRTISILTLLEADFIVRIWKHPLNSKENLDTMVSDIKSIKEDIKYEFVDILL